LQAQGKATTKRGFLRNLNSTEVDPLFVAIFDAVDSRVIGSARFDAVFVKNKETLFV
jgi:predicted nucleotide-binding protein (sugar kinase/HSP70/actin superfamily)